MTYPLIPGSTIVPDATIDGYKEVGVNNVPFAATYSAPLDGRPRVMTLTGNITDFGATGPTPPECGSSTFTLKQDATGGHTVAWNAALEWPDGTPVSMPSAANAQLTITLNSMPDGRIEAGGQEMA